MAETVRFQHFQVLTKEDGSLHELGRGAMGITYKAFDTKPALSRRAQGHQIRLSQQRNGQAAVFARGPRGCGAQASECGDRFPPGP